MRQLARTRALVCLEARVLGGWKARDVAYQKTISYIDFSLVDSDLRV